MIISVIYAGSFILMEETLEKTERTESEKEAIHYQFNSSKSTKLSKIKKRKKGSFQPSSAFIPVANANPSSLVDFNINHIYFTSFLDSSQTI